MNVLIVTTSYPTPARPDKAPFIKILVDSLSSHINVRVLYPGCHKHANNELTFTTFSNLTDGAGIPTNFKGSWKARLQFPLFCISFAYHILKHAKNKDIIHAQWALSGLCALPAKWIFKKKLIVTFRGSDVNLALRNPLTKLILKFLLAHADILTANNMHHCTTIKNMFLKMCNLTPNGLDHIKYSVPKQKARRILRIPSESEIILFVGRLIPLKRVNNLITSFLALCREHPNAHLYLVGSGPEETPLKTLTNNHPRIHFEGSKSPSEVINYYCSADIFVLPSIREGRPNVIGEAMSAGCAIISTDIPGSSEIIDDKQDGVLVPPDNIFQLAQALTTLLNDPVYRTQLGNSAKQSIRRKIPTWKQSTEKLIKIYQGMV